jgi:hypothetical protein
MPARSDNFRMPDLAARFDDQTLLEMLRTGQILVEELTDWEHQQIFGCSRKDIENLRIRLMRTIRQDISVNEKFRQLPKAS